MNEELEQKIRAEVWKAESNKPSDVQLGALFSEFWKRKLIIIVLGFGFGLLGILYALSLPDLYESEATIAAAPNSANNSLGGISGQLGGLASLAGLNLGSNTGVDQTQLALEVLRSQRFVTNFVEKYNYKPMLFAVDKWEPTTKKLIYNPEIYSPDTESWNRDVEFPLQPEPSGQEVYELIEEVLVIEAGDSAGFFRISFLHQSPVFAQEFVENIIAELNLYMRQLDQREAVRSIEFLNNKMQEVSVSEIRSVMYELIEEQTKKLMLTEVRPEYAFQVVDPAVVPERRAAPARTLTVIFFGFLGGVIALIGIVVNVMYRNIKAETRKEP